MNIRSTFASREAQRRNEILRKNVDDTLTRLAVYAWKPQRVSTEIAKYILLNHELLIIRGKTYSTQVRNVGAGVKEIYLKET